MPADANVFQALIQPPKSVMDYQTEMDQRDALRQRNALQNLALQQQTDQVGQGLEDRNALRRVAASWTPQTTVAERVASLRATGRPGLMQQADTLETQDLTRRKTDAEINAKTADTASKGFKLTQEKRQAALQRLAGFQSPQDAIADLNASVGRGELSMQEAQAHAQRIPQDPAQFAQWQLATLRGLMTPEQAFAAAKPVLGTRDNGGVIENITTDPITGKVSVQASTQKVQTPGEVATTGLGYAKLAEDKRHNTATEADGKTQVVNDADRGIIIVNKTTRLARPAVGLDGKPIATESATKRENASKRAIPILDEADKLIDQSTGSYIGAGVDQAARAVGLATKGDKAAAQLKVLEGNLMLAQPRMEGPQSVKDVMLYKQMAGQIGDPTVPNSIKKAALGEIRRLHEKYAGATPQAQPSGPAPQKVVDDAGYDLLPSGAVFIGPDGKTRRKP